jgi:hypothetical protein
MDTVQKVHPSKVDECGTSMVQWGVERLKASQDNYRDAQSLHIVASLQQRVGMQFSEVPEWRLRAGRGIVPSDHLTGL